VNGLERRYEVEEGQGRAALAGWVSHPLVRKVIETTRPFAELTVEPLSRHLVDQVAVTRLVLRVFDAAVMYPDDAPSTGSVLAATM
jgi:hypothetical protein